MEITIHRPIDYAIDLSWLRQASISRTIQTQLRLTRSNATEGWADGPGNRCNQAENIQPYPARKPAIPLSDGNQAVVVHTGEKAPLSRCHR